MCGGPCGGLCEVRSMIQGLADEAAANAEKTAAVGLRAQILWEDTRASVKTSRMTSQRTWMLKIDVDMRCDCCLTGC